ncbi:MAG TPA: hypothetical protein VHM90_07365, partial [Phycisphaerae bacterium]|nr:hypothetical protein [Phycisphaerae bacterium]
AAFAPSLVGQKTATHELTVQLPGGGTETIAYTGTVVPSVTFNAPRVMASSPAWFSDWMPPSFVALDPFIADMDRHMDMLAKTPLLMSPTPSQPLSQAALSNLPAGTSYSVVSEANGNGVCTRFTQITKATGDATPKIVSQSSGNCGNGPERGPSQPTQAAKAINLRTTSGPLTARTM